MLSALFLVSLRFDSDLDKNEDNSLGKEEILAWIIPSNEEIATDEVRIQFSLIRKYK